MDKNLDYPDADLSKVDTLEPHTCPFKVEINGDTETLCYCSPAQQYDCEMDI